MVYLYRTIINGICCEIGVASKPKATLILCPGLPGIPKEQDFLKELTANGYNTIYPRYRGTLESSGEFLVNSPSADIVEVIEYLAKHKRFLELFGHTEIAIEPKNLIIAGGSFGGGVAFEALYRLGRGNALILCPVTDFQSQGSIKKEHKMVDVARFINEGYPFIYRTAPKGFERLSNNELIKPAALLLPKIQGKIILFHGRDDTTVDPSRSEALAKFANVQLQIVDGGHMPFSALPKELLLEALSSLSSK